MPMLRTTALVHASARTVTGALVEVLSRRAELVSVSDLQVSAVLPTGAFRAARLTGQCAQTPAGTLLTCSFSWAGGSFGVRGAVLSVLDAVVTGAATRAEAVAGAQVVVGAALLRDGRVLAQQRAFPDSVAGLWELPGGRVEPGESDHAALVRECAEELGVPVVPGPQVGPDVILPSDKLLRIYQGTMPPDAMPVALEHKDLRWLTPTELDDLDWLPADRILLPCLVTLVSGFYG